MSVHETLGSCIVISDNVELEAESQQNRFAGHRVVTFIREKFLVEDAKEVVKEAYVSESKTKYLILASNEFTVIAQNSLLKILEEPPRNIEFIIISLRKSNLLPTVRSRLPIIKSQHSGSFSDIDFNLAKIDYAQIFAFLKEHGRITKNEAKSLIEALYFRATVIDKLILSESQLNNFDKAYRLLDLNSRPQSVFAFVLMGFVVER